MIRFTPPCPITKADHENMNLGTPTVDPKFRVCRHCHKVLALDETPWPFGPGKERQETFDV